MTSFKLERKAVGATLTKFHVVDSAGAVVGSINVANEQASDLPKHWRGSSVPTASAAAQHQSAVSAISNALRKGPRLSKEASRAAILRGC
jgi:hypothetical protein